MPCTDMTPPPPAMHCDNRWPFTPSVSLRLLLSFTPGGEDRLADPSDVADLRAALPHGVLVSEVHVGRYEHMDFIWGQDAASTLYGQLAMEMMKLT